MKIKSKYFAKIIALVFATLSTLFGIANSSIAPSRIENKSSDLKINNLGFLKDSECNKETHIKGNQSSLLMNVIWASSQENNKEKDAFYLKGISDTMNDFQFDSEEKIQEYKKITISNLLKKDEVVQNFSFGDANDYLSHNCASIAFWTKTTNDNKYHIYTAGHSHRQLGRQVLSQDEYKTFKRIKNPTDNSENFDEIKELSLTADTLTIWTKDSKNNDHIYFGGQNYGQFGDGTIFSAYEKLLEKTTAIKNSINNEKIKDIAFDYNESGFILTENNKLFAAGEDSYLEIGLPAEKHITTFKEVNTKIFNGAKIKQMSTNTAGTNHYQSLILVTEDNKLWGLGYDGSYDDNKKHKGHSLGIHPDWRTKYLEKITNIPIKGIIKNEKILYAQTCSVYLSAYSFLITEDNDHKYKVYMAGLGIQFHSTDTRNYGWAYNDELTNKIFGENGLDVNFNIENLGNAKYKKPVILTTYNITAMGQTKNEKEFQQQSLVLGHIYGGNYYSWKTSPIKIKEPIIDNSSVKIEDSIDKKSRKKQITYTFNINAYDNTIIYDQISKKVDPDSKVGQEKYELKEGDSNGKGVKVIISNIDLSGKKDITYNGVGHKFKLTIGYQFEGSKTKYIKPKENKFNSFVIRKDVKIDIERDGSPEIKTNKFIYNFKMKQSIGNYVWKSKGDAGTGLSAKIIPNSKLQGANIKLEKRVKGKNLYSLIVSNVRNKQETYNLDKCISLEGDYKDPSHKIIGQRTWKIKDHFKLGYLDFKPTPIPTPSINNVKIKDNVTDIKNSKGTIEYIFDINTQGDTIIKEQTKLKKPNPIGQETYELKSGDVNGKGWSVVINNVDTTIPKDKPRIYNEVGNNFTLKVAYTNNKYPGTPTHYSTFDNNTFNPFIINKAIDIKMSKNEKIKMSKDSFTYKFTMDINGGLNGHHFINEGELGTGLTSKIKKGSHLEEVGAKSMLSKNSDGSFTLTIYNLPDTKDNYDIDGTSIYLEGWYVDGDHKEIGKGKFHMNFNFKDVHSLCLQHFEQVISTLQIILIVVGGALLFTLLLGGSLVWLLFYEFVKKMIKHLLNIK